MQKKPFDAKKMCIIAVMAAMFVVLEMLSISTGNSMKITFSGLPVIITSVVFGPVSGMATGLLGSFISQMLRYGFSVTTVLWILPAGVRGLSMGLMFAAFKRRLEWKSIGISVIVSSAAVTAFNTLAIFVDSKIYGYYSFDVVFGMTMFRVISSVLTAVVYILVLMPILNALKDKMKR